jgi:hypothetical protein
MDNAIFFVPAVNDVVLAVKTVTSRFSVDIPSSVTSYALTSAEMRRRIWHEKNLPPSIRLNSSTLSMKRTPV